ncbi:MAG: SAM-dependent methyltransferase [Candidatus Dormibacteraeota bacterium]|nr:SAM-dependent methyltransferase [Candidatus Dormibacteraeota bacterium]
MPPGPIQVISMCAGQGRDIIGVLPDHARRADVRARLVELDPENVAWAREAARRHGLTALEIVEADAALSDAYAGLVPADVLLVCGILGNIPEADIERTVQHLSMLGRCGTTVIWTRHRNPPDFTPTLRRWFSDSGYEEVSFDALNNERNPAIGVHRLRGPALPFRPGFRFFTFVR